jgi:hypothetical protein
MVLTKNGQKDNEEKKSKEISKMKNLNSSTHITQLS